MSIYDCILVHKLLKSNAEETHDRQTLRCGDLLAPYFFALVMSVDTSGINRSQLARLEYHCSTECMN